MIRSQSLLGLGRVNSKRVDPSEVDAYVWPTTADNYDMLEECGKGFSATVYRARCLENNKIVAVKKIDLENAPMKLEEIINEAQAMRTANHDNILSLYTSFVHQNDLWMVEPFVSGGSVLNVMKFCHPNGLDEPQIAAIMKEVLKGLDYMHRNSLIHRDIKAGNILLDRESGAVKLADFGVVATLERRGSWGHDAVGRQTMCGTPCWMAPEVLLAEQGAVDMYKSAADIWSVGITLFEMAHGHAPFSKLAPMHVFMKIVRDEPPSLESGDAGDPKKSFSKGFKDVVAQCLHKEPELRPSAKQLLEHKFFKAAPEAKSIVRSLLAPLPPLWDRVQHLKGTKAQEPRADLSPPKPSPKKGISGWDFDVAAIKAEAAKLDVMEEIAEGQSVSGAVNPSTRPQSTRPSEDVRSAHPATRPPSTRPSEDVRSPKAGTPERGPSPVPGQAAPEPSETGKLLAQSASTKSLSSLPHDPAALPPVAPQPGLAPSHSNRSLAESTSANARRQAPEAAATLAPAEPSTAHRVAESSSLYHASGAPSAVPVRSPAPQQPGAGPAAPQDVPPPAPDVRRTIPTGDDGLQAPAASGEVSRATAGNGSRADKHRAGLAHLSVPGTSPPVKGMAAVDGAKAEAGTARGSEAATTPREDDGTAASKMARSRGQSNAGVPSSKEEGPGWRGEEEGGSQTTPVTGAASKAKRIGRFTVIDNESSAAATTPAEGPGPQQVAPDSHRVTDTHPSQPAAHAPSRLSKEAGPHATTPTSSAGLPMPTAVRKEALTHAPSDVSEAGTTLPLGTPPKAPKEGEKKKKKEGKRFAVVQDDATEKVGRVSFQEGMIRSYSVAEMPRTGHGHGQHLGHHGHAVHQRNPLNVTAHDHASVQERHRGAAHAANIVPSLPPTHPHYNAYMAGVGEAAEKLLPALEDALSQIAAMQRAFEGLARQVSELAKAGTAHSSKIHHGQGSQQTVASAESSRPPSPPAVQPAAGVHQSHMVHSQSASVMALQGGHGAAHGHVHSHPHGHPHAHVSQPEMAPAASADGGARVIPAAHS